MVPMLALCSLSLTGAKVAPQDFAIDLFLVGNNERPLVDLDKLNDHSHESPMDILLRSEIGAVGKQDRTFMVLNGGDCSVFSDIYPQQVTYGVRRDVVTPKEEEKLARETSPKHVMMGVPQPGWQFTTGQATPLPFRHSQPHSAYVYRTSISIPGLDSRDTISVEDLVSLKTSRASTHPEPDPEFVVSRESLEDTQQVLGSDFKGIVVCARGLDDLDSSHFAIFPPKNVIAHYKLVRMDGTLKLQFVAFAHVKSQ